MASADRIKTRILIISDTHSVGPKPKDPDAPTTDDEFSTLDVDVQRTPTGFRDPLPEADVVLHCGDLTKRSQPIEYERTFSMLRRLKAPLKLVIAGNHDGALDRNWYEKWEQPRRDPHMEIPAEAERIIADAKKDGVKYLVEGDYTFHLANGAKLRVYASQWTPEFGSWGFQYDSDGHDFNIPSDVDIAMTHGPPQGVLDAAGWDAHPAGCEHLFRSVYRSRPRVHCFGHIHEGWGAYLATWKTAENQYDVTTHTVIDADESKYVEEPPGASRYYVKEDTQTKQAKVQRLKQRAKDRAIVVDISDGENQVRENEQTLFVNAAIMNIHYRPTQCPWLINIDLPKSAPLQ